MAERLGLRVSKRIFRDGVARALDAVDGLHVVCAAETFTDLLRLAQTHNLDCVVVEVGRGETDARAAVAALRHAHPHLRIVIVHEVDRFEVYRLQRLGADVATDRRDGIGGIVAAITGQRPDHSAPRFEPEADESVVQVDSSLSLTPRERQVLELVATGLTSRAISTHLAVSPKTVENHKQRIFHKLRVQNQGHAVAVALRAGLIAAVPDTLVIDLRDPAPAVPVPGLVLAAG